LLITAAERGGGDKVLRDNGPAGGAERWGGGEGDCMRSMTPVESGAPRPKVIRGDMLLPRKGGGEVFPGGGGGGGKVKDSSVGVVPK